MANKGLVLTGFMGVGKSTVGPRVAKKLGLAYYDTDQQMEMAGIDVPSLVRTDQTAFRKLEIKTLEDTLEQEPGVISTGGGIVSTEIGRRVLLSTTLPVIWLRAPFDDLKKRVAQDATQERPLFDDIKAARELYWQRLGWYATTSGASVNALLPAENIVEDIVRLVRPGLQTISS